MIHIAQKIYSTILLALCLVPYQTKAVLFIKQIPGAISLWVKGEDKFFRKIAFFSPETDCKEISLSTNPIRKKKFLVGLDRSDKRTTEVAYEFTLKDVSKNDIFILEPSGVIKST